MKGKCYTEEPNNYQRPHSSLGYQAAAVYEARASGYHAFVSLRVATPGGRSIPITQLLDDIPSDLGHHRALKKLPNEEGYRDLSNE